jgi:signal transduction histidine kinase
MELNKTRRWFYALTLLWVLMLLGLGSWWLYLVFKLHTSLSLINLPEIGSQAKFLNMMKWEGSFFFIFLTLLGSSLVVMYLRDMKKTNAMQAFFASLSHELKTPLASMRLQSEVIKDLIEDETHSHEKLSELAARLIEDTSKLESELEKSLQLSRIERDGELNLAPVSLERYLKRYQQKLPSGITIELNLQDHATEIMADELALNVIFRNLIENTIRHNPTSTKILISTQPQFDQIKLTYTDGGGYFKGNIHRLGELFYKFNSTKGSGIGLYLIKNLMRKMHGQLIIHQNHNLEFHLIFKKISGEAHV